MSPGRTTLPLISKNTSGCIIRKRATRSLLSSICSLLRMTETQAAYILLIPWDVAVSGREGSPTTSLALFPASAEAGQDCWGLAGLPKFKDHNTSCSACKTMVSSQLEWGCLIQELHGKTKGKVCCCHYQMSEVTEIGLDVIALTSASPNLGKTGQFWPLPPGYFQYGSLLVRAAKCTCLFKLSWCFLFFPNAPPNVQTLSRNRVVWGGHSTATSCHGISGSATGGSGFLFCWCSMPLNNRGKAKTAGSKHCKTVFYMSCPPASLLCPGHPQPYRPMLIHGQQWKRGGRGTRGWGDKGSKVPLLYKQLGPLGSRSETTGWVFLVSFFLPPVRKNMRSTCSASAASVSARVTHAFLWHLKHFMCPSTWFSASSWDKHF